MRVLITNDDGIDSPGLVPLAHAALAAGHEVLVAAPNKEYSGAAASLQGEPEDGGFRIREGRPDGLDDAVRSVAVHASPAMIAYGAAMGAFGFVPELLLSGINLGPNVGPAVVHSGTVGAALTAAAMSIPALAASMSTLDPTHWETAESVLARVLPTMPELPRDGRVLNVNIPDVPVSEVRGLRRAVLGRYAAEPHHAADQVRMLLGGDAIVALSSQFADDSDGFLLSENWATISLVRGPVHDLDGYDLPEFDAHN
ncbi:5'/3'-nucleotidase SurE [Pseudactinotalea sp. HY158]|uniref:5'/3'-nucleotidase SurE n=1 Tax=Pseudactinotalea sp. HY158 TaxID=2654547 RepID=UPI0018924BD8|nr:5'/3'-nucleotidase SurE [Pseudactinotalea sp. HY158]